MVGIVAGRCRLVMPRSGRYPHPDPKRRKNLETAAI
jgi:hypothetical protein